MEKSDTDSDYSPKPQTSNFGKITKNKELYEEYLKRMPEFEESSTIQANEFDCDLEWYNSEPLYYESNLKNKLVLIDFWTSCCCDCLHLLPVLEKLEHKFENLPGLAFIGVHSGKFEAESDSYHLRKNILKYDIKHPVINDVSMQLWSEYECYYWPTVFIIAPNQKVLKVYKELVPPEDLEIFLEAAYDYYSADLDMTPLPIKLESEKEKDEKQKLAMSGQTFSKEKEYAIKSNLRFPHKILHVSKDECDIYGCDFLVISDMGNHRVVIVSEETYACLDVIGAGKSGYLDGSFSEAKFNQTFGTAYLDGLLYICDGKNHLIRSADLNSKQVTTVAGTGIRSLDAIANNVNMREQNLSTPFDIIHDKNEKCLFVAMSGNHQIWKLDIATQIMKPYSGSTVEGCHDDQSDLMNCTWAQPSGIAVGEGPNSKQELYIADSESSTIRAINVTDGDSARTLVGGDGSSSNLFSYGDKDGHGLEAKLQHPVGLDYVHMIKKVIVCDSYNHKIKLLDPLTNEIVTLYGDGSGDLKDGQGHSCQLMEPTDVCYKYDSTADEVYLYIADSSNDAIRKVLIYREGQIIKDSIVETIHFKKIPSVVEVVKSNMVECGASGCKWVRPTKKSSQNPKSESAQEPLGTQTFTA